LHSSCTSVLSLTSPLDSPVLPSFPTRRSSDLQSTLARFPQLRPALADFAGKLSASDIRRLNYAVDAQHEDAAAVVRAFRQSRGLDRKSTRLNSSHGSISYAVFCLKKKTHTTIN